MILRRIPGVDPQGQFSELVSNTGTDAATYTDATVAAETRYTYRIKAINEHGASERSRWYHIDTPAAPEPETDPADLAPTGLAATLAGGQVVLSWNAPAEDADTVTGYEVLRAEGQGELSTLAADTGNADTTYTDATVASAGASYAYRVKAIRDGERSGASNEARVQLKPANPTGLSADAVAYNAVTLAWDEPDYDGVTGYVVMRLDFVRSDLVTLAANTGTADTDYTDETVEPDTLYFYYLMAINPGGESELSDHAVAHTPEAPDPALFAPSNLTVELVDGRVSLGWDPPAEDAGTVTGYAILRARGWDDPIVLSADTGSAATAYTDETADAPGESYAYRVKAIREGERSQASDPAVIQLPGPPPSAPAGLIATFGVGGVFLSWQAPVEDAGTVTGYEVLRTQGGGELTTLVANTGNAATTHTDATAGGASERYTYRVRAIRGGERSADSNEARVQLPPAAPRRVVSAAASDLVLLSWADPGDDSVTGYRILRRQAIADVASDFVTLAEDTGSAETSYADDTVKTGRVYVYQVLAIGPGGLSEPSRDVRVSTFAPVAPAAPLTGTRAHVTSTLVSNLGQDDKPDSDVIVGTFIEIALGFTTGPYSRGYNLRGVILDVAELPRTPEGVRVELWSATSDDPPAPQGKVATLTRATGTWKAGKNTFNAPAGTTLEAGTTYFVFLSTTSPFNVEDTASTTLDAGTAPGWSHSQYFWRAHDPVGDWASSATIIARFAVLGSFVLTPDPPGQNVSEPDGDECFNTANTQCRVAVGGSVTGDLTSGDADSFAADLLAGETYRIDLEGADTGQGTNTDLFLRVYDYDLVSSQGSQIVASDEDSGEGNNSLVTFTPDTTKTYYLEAIGTRDLITGQNAQGTYRLTVRNTRNFSISEPDGEDFGDTATATIGRVAVGGSATGNIDSDTDADWFEVHLEVGHTYQIDVEGVDTGQGTLADPGLWSLSGYFEAAPGTLANLGSTGNRDGGEGKNARIKYTVSDDLLPGTFYIWVHGQDGTEGTYRLRVREVAGSGHGRDMPLEGRLQPGGSLSGTLGVPTNYGIFSYYFAMENLEVGRYTVDFGTGGIDSIHHFLTDRERTGHVTLEDTWIIVDQAHGRRSFTFDVRPGMEGTHYALLSIRRNDTGDYTATLEKAMPHLRVGRTGVVGEVPADSDGFAVHMEFFSVDLEAGQKYRVDIEGKHSADEECEDDDGNDEVCTLDHTMLGNIQAPDGDYVGGDGNFDDSDDDVGGSVLHFYGGGDRGNTRFTFTADQDGTHFLKVGGRLMRIEGEGGTFSSGFRAGTFRLSVREVR